MATIKAAGRRTAGSSEGHLSQSGVSSGHKTPPSLTLPLKEYLMLRHFGKITALTASLELTIPLNFVRRNV